MDDLEENQLDLDEVDPDEYKIKIRAAVEVAQQYLSEVSNIASPA